MGSICIWADNSNFFNIFTYVQTIIYIILEFFIYKSSGKNLIKDFS